MLIPWVYAYADVYDGQTSIASIAFDQGPGRGMIEVFMLNGEWSSVRCDYDADVVALIKSLPTEARTWSPEHRIWAVRYTYVRHLVNRFRTRGFDVQLVDNRSDAERQRQDGWEERERKRRQQEREQEQRQRQRQQRQQRRERSEPPPSPDWAASLFTAVGPDRVHLIYRAMSKVLHPDVENGDHRLMQELNCAYEYARLQAMERWAK